MKQFLQIQSDIKPNVYKTLLLLIRAMNTRFDRQGCVCFMTRFILSKIYQNIRNSSYIYQKTTNTIEYSKKHNCFQLDLCGLNMEYVTRGVSLFVADN